MMMDKKSPLHMLSGILILVGALNWGLTGLGSFLGINLNIVNIILGSVPTLENIVYLLVGAAGVLCILLCMGKKEKM
jgi:uncharacterized membrane protein YuzA (DUF378 family)